MSTIVLRITKGSPLTFTELDDNFTNINNGKLEINGSNSMTGSLPMGNQRMIALASGAVGTPAITFNSETTGPYLVGAGHVGFSIAGTKALGLLSTGLIVGSGTPSAWKSTGRVIEIGSPGTALYNDPTVNATLSLTYNAFLNTSSDWKFVANGKAAALNLDQGLTFYRTITGTAGNTITFLSAFSIGSTGLLNSSCDVGTSPASLDSGEIAAFSNYSTPTDARLVMFGQIGASTAYMRIGAVNPFVAARFGLYVNSSEVLGIETTGAASFISSVNATAFNVTSERDLKDKIDPIKTNALARIQAIPLYEFEYKNHAGRRQVGSMADEIDSRYTDGKTISISSVVFDLVKAVQEIADAQRV